MLSAPTVRVVDRFDPSEVPRGHRTRLLVNLVDDALGMPVQLPMLVARGERAGPVFGLTAAVHGNEINGIPLVHELFDRIDLRSLRGTVAAAMVVNVPAFHGQRRRFSEGFDLNHMFPGVAGGHVAQVYAHRVLDRIIRPFDALMDLHTASFGRVNSLYVRADLEDERTARMALLQRPQIVLHNPPSDFTLRGAADELGIPAITVEIGNPQRFQPAYIRRALSGVRAVLTDLGMVPRRKLPTLAEPIVCSESEWLFTDRGGLLEVFPDVTSRVYKGEILAKISNIFGDLLCEVTAPHDGIVIGKSSNPVAPTGARILHLGTLRSGNLPPVIAPAPSEESK